MQDIKAVMNKKVALDDGTEIEGYKAWMCAMLLGTSLFKEYDLTIAYNVPIWKIAYKCDDGKYQSFDEMMDENCPDKRTKFDLVVCRQNEVLVGINFDYDTVKNIKIRLPLLTVDVNNIREETIKTIVEWLSKKIATGEQSKYLYCPSRNRKIERIPLKRRLDIVEDEYMIS